MKTREDLPSDFSDEEIDEDEAFDDEDREMYRGMTFTTVKRRKAKDGVYRRRRFRRRRLGELIARAQNEDERRMGNDDDHNDKAKEERDEELADSY